MMVSTEPGAAWACRWTAAASQSKTATAPKGIYFVRYVAPGTADDKKPGFFSRMFSGSQPDAAPARYRVLVRSQDNRSTVAVLDAQGQPDTTGNAARIAQLLVDDLK